MSLIKPPSTLEKITGNVTTEALLTLLSQLSGNPLVALLPVLTKSLASERQRERVEKALSDIENILQENKQTLKDITDEQYKLINETILALYQTTDPNKMDYLRRAINHTLNMKDILPQESVVLSRVIRDISADEANFINKYYGYKRIQIVTRNADDDKEMLAVLPDSPDNLIVNGLLSLGLLEEAGSTWGGTNKLRYSSIVVKLLVLLKKDPES